MLMIKRSYDLHFTSSIKYWIILIKMNQIFSVDMDFFLFSSKNKGKNHKATNKCITPIDALLELVEIIHHIIFKPSTQNSLKQISYANIKLISICLKHNIKMKSNSINSKKNISCFIRFFFYITTKKQQAV